MKNVMNTEFQHGGGVKPSCKATFPDLTRRFFESIKKKCCELLLVNSESTSNKQANDNKVDSPLSWIIASLGQVAHFTSVVIHNDNKVDSPLTTHNSLVKAIAFTLAETLVVMGIIGVVAALTIPNLNQSTGDREKVAKVKKIYANLEDAYGRATAVYGPVSEWLTFDFDENGNIDNEARTNRFAERITEFMKISKDCGFDGTGCFADNYKTLVEGDEKPSPGEDGDIPMRMFLLADGTALAIRAGRFIIDIDGPKGSNTYGKDYFMFILSSRNENFGELQPAGYNLSGNNLIEKCFFLGEGCAAWVINTGNMDYTKLNVQTGKCPNGTELSWENTSCK